MIVLTGTTGGLGSQILKYILSLDLIPPSQLIISLYNTSSAPADLPSSVQIRQGDFSRPESLDVAFAGADTLLLVSYPSIAHKLRVDSHVHAIDAAKRAGIKRIYYTSLAFADGSVSAVMQAHLDTEAYLKQSGLAYTIVREGIYAESYPLYLGFFDSSKGVDDIYVPGDGPIAWVSREDLGEGMARLIASGAHENQTLLFSGPLSNKLTLREVAALLSNCLSRPLAIHIVDVEEYVQRFHDETSPWATEAFLRAWAKTFDAMARGETGKVDDHLERILGRPLRSMEEVVRNKLDQEAVTQYAK